MKLFTLLFLLSLSAVGADTRLSDNQYEADDYETATHEARELYDACTITSVPLKDLGVTDCDDYLTGEY